MTISGNFEHIQYCNFETNFLENGNLFQKIGILFEGDFFLWVSLSGYNSCSFWYFSLAFCIKRYLSISWLKYLFDTPVKSCTGLLRNLNFDNFALSGRDLGEGYMYLEVAQKDRPDSFLSSCPELGLKLTHIADKEGKKDPKISKKFMSPFCALIHLLQGYRVIFRKQYFIVAFLNLCAGPLGTKYQKIVSALFLSIPRIKLRH